MLIKSKAYIFVIWTLLNIIQDTLYKYSKLLPEELLLVRYIFIFIFFFIFFLLLKKRNKDHQNTPIKINNKEIYQYIFRNFLNSLISFLALYFCFKQIKITSVLNTSLIFYTVPFFDFLGSKLCGIKNQLHKKWIIVNILTSSVIFLYYTYNYKITEYYYGFLSSVFFAISNNIIYFNKKKWSNNIINTNKEIGLFSFFMIIFVFLLFFRNFSKLHIFFNNIYNINSIFYTFFIGIMGIITQWLLFYLFVFNEYSPSSFMSYSDLLFAAIADMVLWQVIPTYIQIFIIAIIIVVPKIFK